VAQIDYIPFTHAVHRLSGIVTPASAAYSAAELEHQLRSSGAKALFTCAPLLDSARAAARAVGIPDEAIFILPTPKTENPRGLRTVDDLVALGESLPELPSLRWVKGQGARQVAYLCYSSGTSGLPVGVALSHTHTAESLAGS
jgi:acyl-CoA synthetase (AMP-forming)/AMP-acid ligase II